MHTIQGNERRTVGNKASKGKRVSNKQSWGKGFKKLSNELTEMAGAWDKRFDGLLDRFRKLTVAIGQQMGGINANQQVHSDILEKLDVNVQVLAKMIREIYGKLEQVDVLIARLYEQPRTALEEPTTNLTPLEAKEIRDRADQLFTDVMREMFTQVREEREAAMKTHREAAKREKEEAEKAKQEKEAAEKAEEELQAAEKEVVGEPGGEGAAIPEEAEVFGG
jgi:hypothetical protein